MLYARKKNLIDTCVSSRLFGIDFIVTWVYDDPNYARRSCNWETLKRIGTNRRKAWICARDFNYITHHREKIEEG